MEAEILTTLNQILAQLDSIPSERSWIETWAPSISAIIGIFITALLSYYLGFRSQIKLADRKQKQLSYGNLMGCNHYFSQLVVSRFEAYIFSDYHEERWRLSGAHEESLDLIEAKRWMLKSEDLVLELTKYQEKVFSNLGVITTVYDNSDELTNLVNNIYRFKRPAVIKIPENTEIQALDAWKIQAVNQLKKHIQKELSTPIDKLLEYLRHNV